MSALDVVAIWGRAFKEGDYLMLFSMRLDETGTDGTSPYVTVGGAVAPLPHWLALEKRWRALLTQKGISAFHLKEFDQREKQFNGWRKLKCELFERRLVKIIESNVTFRVAISIDSAAHANVKKRMQGIKGFSPSSDYSLCLRYLMFHACQVLEGIDPDCQLAVLVEDGPYAAGAAATYQKVAAMQSPWKPAKHAHRLAGFGSLPKGLLPSLEAVDYIVGREHESLSVGRPSSSPNALRHLLCADDLEGWYEGMMREKEHRRAYGRRTKGAD